MTEDLTSDLMAAVPDPMLLVDAEGLIARANAAALTLLGEWILSRSYLTALRQPNLLGRIEAVQGGEDGGEARFEKTDEAGDTLFRVRITPFGPGRAAAPLRTPLRRPVLLHFTDITHLRETEEMRRDFVANVSHELRTPLTAVMGFIETLRGPARDDPQAQDRFLSIMEEEARRMNRLVSDLLSLSRVEAAERMRPIEAVDLAQVVKSAVATLRPVASDTGNALEVVGAEDDVHVIRGDADQLTQVVVNLVENALKYGGRDKAVTVRLSQDSGGNSLPGPVVRLEVVDRGEGIDPVHIPRLTERFYRVDTHRSRAMGGTGLGLAIVKHIVNRHRGRLRVLSERGSGTVVTAVFPAMTKG